MQTPKEALLAIYGGKKAEYVPDIWTYMKDLAFPGERYFPLDGSFDPYGTGPDAWGVQWTNLGPNPAVDGNMVAKDFRLFDDMEDWKKYVHFPQIEHFPISDILHGMMQAMHYNPETDVLSVLLLSGQFERLNEMIGMENALCSFYEYPDEMHEFFNAMCEYKLKCIDLACEAVHPDVIHMHDDWGSGKNMFFSPDLWREYIKPNEAKYAQRIHEHGALYQHHSCGYIMQIIPDLVEIGVDVIDPMMICNDLDQVLEQYGQQITVAGGIDNQRLDLKTTSEEEARELIRNTMRKYCNKGRFIPYYIPTDAGKLAIFSDEVNRFGKEIYREKSLV